MWQKIRVHSSIGFRPDIRGSSAKEQNYIYKCNGMPMSRGSLFRNSLNTENRRSINAVVSASSGVNCFALFSVAASVLGLRACRGSAGSDFGLAIVEKR